MLWTLFGYIGFILDNTTLRFYYAHRLSEDSQVEKESLNIGGTTIMGITKYDPFRELRSLQDEMNRLFTGAFPKAGMQEELLRGAWAPNVDIYENKEQLVIQAELPGMRTGDVEVSIENNVLTLRGERKFEKRDEGDNFHRIERAYGSFSRSFTLPQTVTAEGADANFTDGILTISLQKREETKARKIEIKVADESAAKVLEAKA